MKIVCIALFLTLLFFSSAIPSGAMGSEEYAVEVREDIYWLPLQALGDKTVCTEDLEIIKGDPQKLKEEIYTLLDAVYYLQSFFRVGDSFNQELSQGYHPSFAGSVRWEFPEPPESAIERQVGNNAAVSNVISYLLRDNYEEMGYIWGIRARRSLFESVHYLNYIRVGEHYYILDAEPYLRPGATENMGDMDEYDAWETFAHLHRVKDLDTFVQYYSEKREEIAIVARYSGAMSFPFASGFQDNRRVTGIPHTVDDTAFDIVWIRPETSLRVVSVSPPRQAPAEYRYYSDYMSYMPGINRVGEFRLQGGPAYYFFPHIDKQGPGFIVKGDYQVSPYFSINTGVEYFQAHIPVTGIGLAVEYQAPNIDIFRLSIRGGAGYYLGDMGSVFSAPGYKFGLSLQYNFLPGPLLGIDGAYRHLVVEEGGDEKNLSGWEISGSLGYRF